MKISYVAYAMVGFVVCAGIAATFEEDNIVNRDVDPAVVSSAGGAPPVTDETGGLGIEAQSIADAGPLDPVLNDLLNDFLME